MRLSSGGEDNTTNSCRVSSSSTSLSRSPLSLIPTSKRKTMEDVWKDISLGSLHDHSTREEPGLPSNSTFRGTILQDLLARPFHKDPSTTDPTVARDVTPFGSPAIAPATVLRLHSGPEFHYLDTDHPIRPNSQLHSPDSGATPSYISSFNTPFDAFASPIGFPSFLKKRVPETDGDSGDRRHKRMIKNRESAARFLQAYTNELELEVAHLLEENAKLRQQQQLYLAEAAQLPKKHTLQRTSTAPF
ncbi:hypothetical protein HHK36_002922 [Tetracentron sinense]|uniref:BZIP domain-containing protein n=1 Tax=Tetracentron sinense TaxID=13715 RepID=A0A834ZSE5_TETSI|nr:hypothetical protein HHK36_002922 [Tetracentron sinense]